MAEAVPDSATDTVTAANTSELDHRREFVQRATALQRPASVPELVLHLAGEITPIWQMTEVELATEGLPPPFWAFAWAGGQAVARYVLDHPERVAGRRVLDLAAGSGICGIAACLAGAAGVVAADIDPFCAAIIALNAAANGVEVAFTDVDLLGAPPPAADGVLAGDVCYEQQMSRQMLGWLRQAHEAGALVLLGDPGRAYLDTGGLTLLAEYDIVTTPELEDAASKRTRVYTLA